jgi:hypothetical protein
MASVIPQDGPPTQVTIAGSTWKIMRVGRSLPAGSLTKDLIVRYGLCWDSVTWVARSPSTTGASSSGSTLVAFPLIWCHRAAEQAFLTPQQAAEIDIITAERAGVSVSELDRTEKLTFDFDGAVLNVSSRPTEKELSPAGYKQPPKRTKHDDNDDDDEAGGQERKGKGKGKSGEPKGECAWFLGRLTSDEDGGSDVVDDVAAFNTTIPVKTPTAKDVPPPAATARGKSGTATANGGGAKKLGTSTGTGAAAANGGAPAKKVATLVPCDVFDNGHGKAKPKQNGGAAVGVTGTPSKALASNKSRPAAATVPSASPVGATKGVKPSTPGNAGAQRAAAVGGGGGGDVLFEIQKGNHEGNVQRIMAYLSTAPDVPEQTRALVTCLYDAARKKPDEKQHLFRANNMPTTKWTKNGIKEAIESGEIDEAKTTSEFCTMRAVFAEMLSVKRKRNFNTDVL